MTTFRNPIFSKVYASIPSTRLYTSDFFKKYVIPPETFSTFIAQYDAEIGVYGPSLSIDFKTEEGYLQFILTYGDYLK